MYCNRVLRMDSEITLKDLLPEKYWHNIYRDEIKDTFLILRGMEVSIYSWSDEILKILFFTPGQFRKYKKIAPFYDVYILGDLTVDCRCKIKYLQHIVQKAGRKIRMYKKSKYRDELVALLGHEIKNYYPRKACVSDTLKKDPKTQRMRQKGGQFAKII